MTRQPSFREKLAMKQPIIGSWIQLAHPAHAEIMARAGFEWLTIDLEHSVISLREAEELIRIVELCGVTPLVRLSSLDAVQIKRIMDAGAHGVIVPMVNTRTDSELAVSYVRYPPKGVRGVGLARAQAYGARFEDYAMWLETESVVIVQIEHIKAVENLSEILSVSGVNGFIIGPYDLSGSLKVPGQFDHQLMQSALGEIQTIASNYPYIAPGYHVVSPLPELVLRKIGDGFRLIAYSTDMHFLGESCRNAFNEISERIGRNGKS